MKTLKLKKKNDASPCNTAMPACGLFEFKAASNREKREREENSNASFRENLKYALRNQPFVCFNVRINHLKKTP